MGSFSINSTILVDLWVIIPTYIFFTIVLLVFASLFDSTIIGVGIAGTLWLLPLILGRKYPYWLHPFYYYSEFEHFGYDFMIQNKLILMIITVLILFFFIIYTNRENIFRKLAKIAIEIIYNK